jgi:hypothetical protein
MHVPGAEIGSGKGKRANPDLAGPQDIRYASFGNKSVGLMDLIGIRKVAISKQRLAQLWLKSEKERER